MANDLFDFKSMLDLPKREESRLRREYEDARWADYGRMVFKHIGTPGQLERVINLAALRGRSPEGIAKLVRIYLQTGVINVRD